MLTAEENAVLTQVGPDTPMGRLLRWYWQPIAAASQLDENPVMPVKLLGEALVLYRDRRDTLGLVSDTCAHRRVNLAFGIPEQEGPAVPVPRLALRQHGAVPGDADGIGGQHLP